MGVWFGLAVVTLFILMALDVLLTRYNDFELIRNGSTAVAIRFICKLGAQALIISRSMTVNQTVWDAVVLSFYAFILLLILQWIFDGLMKLLFHIDMARNIAENHTPSGLLAGGLQLVGAVILMGSM